MTIPLARVAAAGAFALLLLGCEAFEPFTGPRVDPLPPPAAYRDGSIDFGSVRRILALPLLDESGQGSGGIEVLSRTLRDEIAKLKRFDVVVPAAIDAALRPAETPRSSGVIPVQTIIDLGKRYGVDAVLFGTVTHYRPYAPPQVGLSLTLVDTETGNELWKVDDFVDSADASAAAAMEAWFDAHAATDETVYGKEILRTSPHWFARFAMSRVAGTL